MSFRSDRMALRLLEAAAVVNVAGVIALSWSTCFEMLARALQTVVCALSSLDSPHPAAAIETSRTADVVASLMPRPYVPARAAASSEAGDSGGDRGPRG